MRKRGRILKHYNPKKEYPALKQVGVGVEEIDRVRKAFATYHDELLFRKFSLFFRRDPPTIQRWTGAADPSAAFIRLFHIFQRNELRRLEKRFQELFLLHKLNEKGEGRKYEAAHGRSGSVLKFDPVRFSRLLNRRDERASFTVLPRIQFGEWTILPLLKKGSGSPVYKFIKLDKKDRKLLVRISADSPKEIELIRSVLNNAFRIYLDTPQVHATFDRLAQFLKTGDASHFLLTGGTYFHDEYRISVLPKYGRPQNIASCSSYSGRLANVSKPEAVFTQMRLLHKEIRARSQVFIDFRTPQSSSIIGAVLLNLNDRRLNSEERERIARDFRSDFELPLNEFIEYEDVPEEDVYKKLLQNIPKQPTEFELRSERSLRIYRELVSAGLLPWKVQTNQARFCTKQDCRAAYQTKYNQKTCPVCGENMLAGRATVVEDIDEKRVADFAATICQQLGFQTTQFKRRLLTRDILVVEIRNGDDFIELVPISKALTDNQTEILRLRYPSLVLLTSRDDAAELRQKHFETRELSNFAYSVRKPGAQAYVKRLLADSRGERPTHLTNHASGCRLRFVDDSVYLEKNKASKNFGAELFEADCSVLLSCIFGNSIWLGARKRGKALPDGVTAFPVTGTRNGCFVWDAKFSSTDRVVLGSHDKNRKYISEARANETVAANGGVKGFLFVGNKPAPKTFTGLSRQLVGNKRIKLSYWEMKHLRTLFDHFRAHQTVINSNNDVRDVFVDAVKELLFKTAGRKRAFAMTDEFLDGVMTRSADEYQRLAGARQLHA